MAEESLGLSSGSGAAKPVLTKDQLLSARVRVRVLRRHDARGCRCKPEQIERQLGEVRGPLLDRIDIDVEVPELPFKERRSESEAESSAEIGAAPSIRASQCDFGTRGVGGPISRDLETGSHMTKRISSTPRSESAALITGSYSLLSHAFVGSSGTATSLDPHFPICQVQANQFRNAISDICERICALALSQS